MIFLVFLASIALVSVVLPNLYFRVMLYTDHVTSMQDRHMVQMEKLLVQGLVEQPSWIDKYKDTSWYEEVERRKLKKLLKYRKQKI